MSRVGRATLWTTGALLLIIVLGIFVMLEALEGHVGWLGEVALAPDGTFVREVRADGALWVVIYDDGLELSVPRAPRRIVSTLPGITEMVAHLGAADRLVAVSPWCDTPPSVEMLPEVTVQPFDAEGMLAARPDLVIADRRLHRRDLAVIRQRCPHVLLLESSRSVPHLVSSMRLLAQVLDTPQAVEAARAFGVRARELTERIQAARPTPPPRVLIVGQWDPLYVLGPGALMDDLLRICGCVNVAADLGLDASGTFNEELVISRRPDWILTPEAPIPDRLRERWRSVPAIRTDRLAPASTDDLARGGPRLLGALERLAAVLRGTAAPASLGVPR